MYGTDPKAWGEDSDFADNAAVEEDEAAAGGSAPTTAVRLYLDSNLIGVILVSP